MADLVWTVLPPLAVIIATVAAMEVVAAVVHRHVMHGVGWALHRSHHEPRTGWFEANDLYAVFFALIAIVLIALGAAGRPLLAWIGVGMTAYGVLYALVHDGLVHRRWPFRGRPRKGYLARLVEAHHLHHAVRGRDGCVSFGFLWAPPPERLRSELKRLNPRRADPAAPDGDAGSGPAVPAGPPASGAS
jgi:beta-carotene 3-hydroxylase